jgi:2-polyprenyl-3-methyl-5-hydroxy-6-metoxy-1,4-benzoquinol methylase
MEEIHCIFCANSKEKPFWVENGFTGRKCLTCGLVFISPRPTETEMRSLYENGTAGGATSEQHLEYSYAQTLYNRSILRVIQKHIVSGSLLEIGPGGGRFCKMAKEAGFSVHGIETNRVLAATISERYKISVECGSASDPTLFPGKKFDVIFHKDVLSHLHDPITTFKNMYNKLNDNGIMVFETGNGADLSRFWCSFIGRLSYPEHVFLFGRKNINTLLNKTGFTPLSCVSYSALFAITLNRLLKMIHRLQLRGVPKQQQPDRTSAPKNIGHSVARETISFKEKIRGYILYTTNYRLRGFFPANWPCSMIIVAQKKVPGVIGSNTSCKKP